MVINIDNPKKLVANACYIKQDVRTICNHFMLGKPAAEK